jgi:hypothetical protein
MILSAYRVAILKPLFDLAGPSSISKIFGLMPDTSSPYTAAAVAMLPLRL